MRKLKAAILAGGVLIFALPAYAVTLTSAYVSNPGPVNAMNTGGALQVYAYCKYSDGSTTNCSTTDIHGNAVTAWTSSNSDVLTVNGSGLASGVSIGTATINATITGGIVGTPPFVVTVSGPNTLGLSSLSLATTGGVINTRWDDQPADRDLHLLGWFDHQLHHDRHSWERGEFLYQLGAHGRYRELERPGQRRGSRVDDIQGDDPMRNANRIILLSLFWFTAAAYGQVTATPVFTLPTGTYTMPTNTTITD